MRGWSPETTSSVLRVADALACRAERVAGSERLLLHGDRRSCRMRPRASGERTTTSGSGPSGRTASTTQSTSRRPSSGWRCFGVADFIRVPRPAAITTAAKSVAHQNWGARIRTWDRGTKTRCLTHLATPPLTCASVGRCADSAGEHLATPHRVDLGAPVIREEIHEGDDREDYDRDDRDEPEDESRGRHEDRERLATPRRSTRADARRPSCMLRPATT